MLALRISRIFGWTLVVLGAGSAILRIFFNADTFLTLWMAGAQPWSGVAMAIIGGIIVGIAITVAGRMGSQSDD